MGRRGERLPRSRSKKQKLADAVAELNEGSKSLDIFPVKDGAVDFLRAALKESIPDYMRALEVVQRYKSA